MHEDLTFGELDHQSAELLPTRETLYLNNNWATVLASNSSLALNAATLFSSAESAAFQTVSVNQH